MGYLCIIFAALLVLVGLGHGLWLLTAWLLRQVAGRGVPPPDLPPCPDCSRPLSSLQHACRWCGFDPTSTTEWTFSDLSATHRQLRRFLAAGTIDQSTFDNLRSHVLAEQRRLRQHESERVAEVVAAPAPAPTAEVVTLQVAEAEPSPSPSVLRPAPVPPPAPAPLIQKAAIIPEPEPVPAPVSMVTPAPEPPMPPRQPFRAMLTAFMEARNILWGELVGGLLIVGCSIALVVNLWPTLGKVPYSPFVVFAAVTAALFEAGLYTLRHWRLESTSRGLLVIAALLVPLIFLVMAGLHQAGGGTLLEAALEVACLAAFAGLLRQAACVLTPEGGWLLPAGMLGCTIVQLVAAWLLPTHAALAWVLVLGLAAVACEGASVGGVLWRLRSSSELQSGQAGRLFLHLGIVAFAVLVTLGQLSYGADRLGTVGLFASVLERLAIVVALTGVPVLVAGLRVHTGLATQEDAAGMRTAGTAVALAGMALLLGALPLAWPAPGALMAVSALDFAILTAVAVRGRLPVAHGLAIPCLVLASVTGVLAVWLNVGRETMPAALYSAEGGVALVGLMVALGGVAEGLARCGRPADAVYYVVGTAVTGALGLVLVSVPERGVESPLRALVLYGVAGMTGCALNVRWRWPLAINFNVALLVCASLWGLFAVAADVPRLSWWGTLLALEGMMLAGFATVLRRRWQKKADQWLIEPLARCAEALVLLASGVALWGGLMAGVWSVAHVVTAGGLCAALLILAGAEQRPILARAAGLMLAGTAIAFAGWLSAQVGDASNGNMLARLALALAISAAVQAAGALVTVPGEHHEGSAPSGWHGVLAAAWRDTALATSAAALAMGGVAWASGTPWLVALAFSCMAVTCLMLTQRERQPSWTWVGCTLMLIGLVRLSPAQGWIALLHGPDLALAFLAHATLTLLAGTSLREVRRRLHFPSAEKDELPAQPAAFYRLFIGPLLHVALLSSLLGLAQTLISIWPSRLLQALCLLWLAGMWLWLARLWHSRLLFSGFQSVLCLAAVCGAMAWVEAQPWYGQDAHTLHVYALALALLSVVWMAMRLGEAPQSLAALLHSSGPAVDRVVLGGLVLGQAGLAMLGLMPALVAELGLGELPFTVPAGCFGGTAWVLFGVLTLAVLLGLWERGSSAAVPGLCVLALTAPVLSAGPFINTHSASLALRWGLAASFMVCSALLFMRERLIELARTVGCQVRDALQIPRLCRAVLIVGAVLPILAVSWTAAGNRFMGADLKPPQPGTFFDALHWLVRLGVPLALVSVGLVGHALRERSPGYAFAAGLVVNFTVTGVHALAIFHHASASQLVMQLGQLVTLMFAAWALAWSASRLYLRRRSPWIDSPLAEPLLKTQTLLGAVTGAWWLTGALALLAVAAPSLHPWAAEAGTWLGWLSLISIIAACAWPNWEQRRSVQPRTLGMVGMAVVGLVACSIENLWPGWGYRAWMLGLGGFALGWAILAWRLGPRWSVDARYSAMWSRAANFWVSTASLLAVILAVKAAFWQGDSLWAAGALMLASPAMAIMAIWRHRESWAFIAGLGVNLAASLVVCHWLNVRTIPESATWIYLVEINALAGAVVSFLWLWLCDALYGPAGMRIRSTPLLGVQVIFSAMLAGIPLALAGGWLFLHPGRLWPADLLRIGDAGGWFAWPAALGAAAWYAAQVWPRSIPHILAAYVTGLGILAASLADQASQHLWLSYHVWLAWSAAVGFGLLGLGWQIGRPRVPDEANADLLGMGPANRVWAMFLGAGVTLLGLRIAWDDPVRPYMSMLAALAASALYALVALWRPRPAPLYVSGLLWNLAGLFAWIAWDADHLDEGGWIQIMCFALATLLWCALEQGHGRAGGLRGTWPPFVHLAASLALVLLTGLVGSAVLTSLVGSRGWAGTPLAWLALGTTAAALVGLLLDPTALLASAGLYLVGILALGLGLHTAQVGPRVLGWWTCVGLAGYVLMAGGVAHVWQSRRWLRRTVDGVALDWFIPAQTAVALVAVALSLWVSLDFDGFAWRFAGPVTVALVLPAGIAAADLGRRWMRETTLFLGIVAAVEVGWCLLEPTAYSLAGLWLRRTIALTGGLAFMTMLYGVVFRRWLPSREWATAARRLGPPLGLSAGVVLLAVLGQEAWLYRIGSGVPPVDPLGPLAISIVLTAVVALFGAALTFAVLPDADPFSLSERGRMAYVYAAEALLALMLAHVRLTAGGLFRLGLFTAYWPFIILGLAFLGAGLGELFQRRGLRVLAEPLQHTGIGLPLLPVLAFWLVPAPRYATVWFLAGVLYGLLSLIRRSFRFAFLAACSANAGLWVLLHHHEVYLWRHPQLWLIPPALILLVAEHLNRDRLGHYQGMALRYLALTMIYISSTADFFIAGLGQSWILPLALIVLCVIGILLGMLLRVRAFLFLGSAFLVLTIVLMIWHAGVDQRQAWILWSSGIALGAAIVALFGVFEKRRDEVLRLVEQLKQWQ